MYPRTRDLQPLGQLPAPPGEMHSTGTKGTHTSLKRRRNGKRTQAFSTPPIYHRLGLVGFQT